MNYLIVFLLVFGINLLPAFGPPTWSVLVIAQWHWHMPTWLLVVIGVLAAGAGRFALAHASFVFRRFTSQRYRDNLKRAEERLSKRRRGAWILSSLFIISPLPSAQLFIAAGLVAIPLIPMTVAFMLGRVVTYSLYLTAAHVVHREFRSLLGSAFGSPWSIALQLTLLGLVTLLPALPWRGRKATQ